MKDRLPVNPGRVLITPENGGAAFYATMTRADNPTEEGTPLNKATMLKDSTAAMYGLGEDAVLDDVLSLVPYVAWREIARFDAAGTYEWVADFDGDVGVLVVGGGGSGGVAIFSGTSSSSSIASGYASGGAPGKAESVVFRVKQGESFSIVVGAGGASKTYSGKGGSLQRYGAGNAGGSSSFVSGELAVTALGGAAGASDNDSISLKDGTWGGSWENSNPFTGEQILGGGGGCYANNYTGTATLYRPGVNPITGIGGGAAAALHSQTAGTATAGGATMYGCGGGAACCGVKNSSSYTGTATTGAGADGAVIIYRKGHWA